MISVEFSCWIWRNSLNNTIRFKSCTNPKCWQKKNMSRDCFMSKSRNSCPSVGGHPSGLPTRGLHRVTHRRNNVQHPHNPFPMQATKCWWNYPQKYEKKNTVCFLEMSAVNKHLKNTNHPNHQSCVFGLIGFSMTLHPGLTRLFFTKPPLESNPGWFKKGLNLSWSWGHSGPGGGSII